MNTMHKATRHILTNICRLESQENRRIRRSSSPKLDTPSVWTIVNTMRKAIRHTLTNICRLELQEIEQRRINKLR